MGCSSDALVASSSQQVGEPRAKLVAIARPTAILLDFAEADKACPSSVERSYPATRGS